MFDVQPRLATLFLEFMQEPEPVQLELKLRWATILGQLGAMLFSPSESWFKVLGLYLHPNHIEEGNQKDESTFKVGIWSVESNIEMRYATTQANSFFGAL